MGSTTLLCERIPDKVLTEAFAAYRAYLAKPSLHDETALRGRCSDCMEDGLVGGALYGARCWHRAAFLAMAAEAAGIEAVVTKPYERAVA